MSMSHSGGMYGEERLYQLYAQCQQHYRLQIEQEQQLVRQYQQLLQQSNLQHQEHIKQQAEHHSNQLQQLELNVRQLTDKLKQQPPYVHWQQQPGILPVSAASITPMAAAAGGTDSLSPAGAVIKSRRLESNESSWNTSETEACMSVNKPRHVSYLVDKERVKLAAHLVSDHHYDVAKACDRCFGIKPALVSACLERYEADILLTSVSPHIMEEVNMSSDPAELVTSDNVYFHAESCPALLLIADDGGSLMKREWKLLKLVASEMEEGTVSGVVLVTNKDIAGLCGKMEDSKRMWNAAKEVICGEKCSGYAALIYNVPKLELKQCITWLMQTKFYTNLSSDNDKTIDSLLQQSVKKEMKLMKGGNALQNQGEGDQEQVATQQLQSQASSPASQLMYDTSGTPGVNGTTATATPTSIHFTWTWDGDSGTDSNAAAAAAGAPSESRDEVTLVVRTRLQSRKIAKRLLLPIECPSSGSYILPLEKLGLPMVRVLAGSSVTSCMRPTPTPVQWLLHFPIVHINTTSTTDPPTAAE